VARYHPVRIDGSSKRRKRKVKIKEHQSQFLCSVQEK
jgi:hypothetical protein